VTAVEDFNLTVPGRRMTALVGPSGCGKTTLLRLIAGLDTATSGAIHLAGERLDTLPPRDRDIAMVFQSYALYPHMSVEENLSFGLRLRKTPKEKIAEKVREVVKALEIDELLGRKPGELSGGQRQRVALGRAIIREPRVFLFDEPLSNLDARLRSEMRATIKKLYNRLQVTSIYVTHDQVEAMTIGDLLVVMNRGRIHQVGTPEVCYDRPADTFVASFLGSPSMNFLDSVCPADGGELTVAGGQKIVLPAKAAECLKGHAGEGIIVGIRPEDVRAGAPKDGEDSIHLKGKVILKEPLGHETLTHIEVGKSEMIARGGEEFTGAKGGRTSLFINTRMLHLFSQQSGARITPD
jgi:multiple sugar transport system ATP-binding protein